MTLSLPSAIAFNKNFGTKICSTKIFPEIWVSLQNFCRLVRPGPNLSMVDVPWVPDVFSRAQRLGILRFASAAEGRRHERRTASIQTWPIPETAHEKPLAPRVWSIKLPVIFNIFTNVTDYIQFLDLFVAVVAVRFNKHFTLCLFFFRCIWVNKKTQEMSLLELHSSNITSFSIWTSIRVQG